MFSINFKQKENFFNFNSNQIMVKDFYVSIEIKAMEIERDGCGFFVRSLRYLNLIEIHSFVWNLEKSFFNLNIM